VATSAPPATAANLCLLLSQASHALTTELTAGLAGLGISPRAHCVLSNALAGELTQNRLAELCDLDKTTMVVTIDELERAGLAERRPSRTDRRAHVISVTPAGERLVAEGQEVVARITDDVLAALPAAEREAFVGGLARLAGGRLSTPVRCERPVRRRAARARTLVR
jgi:MarR family transcriptional regulator for hemolysin